MAKDKDRPQKMAEALNLIAEGMSVRMACKSVGISTSMFIHDVNEQQYARAREAGADVHFDEMADLERLCLAGELDSQVFKSVMDSRKWRLSKMRPKVYGDKTVQDNISSDGSMSPAKPVNLGDRPLEEIIAIAKACAYEARGKSSV